MDKCGKTVDKAAYSGENRGKEEVEEMTTYPKYGGSSKTMPISTIKGYQGGQNAHFYTIALWISTILVLPTSGSIPLTLPYLWGKKMAP